MSTIKEQRVILVIDLSKDDDIKLSVQFHPQLIHPDGDKYYRMTDAEKQVQQLAQRIAEIIIDTVKDDG